MADVSKPDEPAPATAPSSIPIATASSSGSRGEAAAGAELVATVNAGRRLDRVADVAQLGDVASHRALGDLEPRRQLARRAVGAGAEHRQQRQETGGGGHDIETRSQVRTDLVRSACDPALMLSAGSHAPMLLAQLVRDHCDARVAAADRHRALHLRRRARRPAAPAAAAPPADPVPVRPLPVPPPRPEDAPPAAA